MSLRTRWANKAYIVGEPLISKALQRAIVDGPSESDDTDGQSLTWLWAGLSIPKAQAMPGHDSVVVKLNSNAKTSCSTRELLGKISRTLLAQA